MSEHKPVKFAGAHDMPDAIISVATMLWNKTGSWRYLRPLYANKVPPCNQSCPLGNDIEGFIRLIEEGSRVDAWVRLKEENPFPRIMGRVCFHPCEANCNRGKFDTSVSIRALERFAGEFADPARVPGPVRSKSGKRVAIIGAGPAGLSCAYFLARLGHKPVIFEAEAEPGGLLRYGIPAYRLPKDILDQEIKDLLRLGVEIKCGVRVGGEKEFGELISEYEAVFIGTGAHRSRELGVDGEEHENVVSGLEFLKGVNSGEQVYVGRKVAVIGGGNTAIDAARVALRRGAKDVTIYYRRSRAEMPAAEEEVLEALKEGAMLEELCAPVRVEISGGKVEGIGMQRMKLGEPDESGRARPIPVEGSTFQAICDHVIKAVGEAPDYGAFPDEILQDGELIVDWFGRTKHEKVFASGDVCLPSRTVVDAAGGGKRAAIAIDRYLRGEPRDADVVRIGPDGNVSFSHYAGEGSAHASLPSDAVVPFESINLDHFFQMRRGKQPELGADERVKGFDEVVLALSEQAALYEATRCFHCGVCTECDNCFAFCPDVAITHSDNGGEPYDINYDYCKGCGICVVECPRNAMVMVEEEKSL